jgi:hypothetical protein
VPEVWAVIVGIIILLILYGIISSRLRVRRQRLARERVMPFVAETIRPGRRYDVYLSDGKKFLDVEVLGTTDPTLEDFSFTGWEGMLVLLQANNKRIYVRHHAVRWVVET